MTKVYVHPLPVRIWHWINALGFVALILTGVQIRYGDLFHVLSFKSAVQLHNGIGFVLVGNFLLWLFFYLFSDQVKVYLPDLNPARHFRGSLRQIRYYSYGIFKGDPNPHHVSPYHKFNPLQIMTYQVIMLMLVPLQFLTGLLLWDLKDFADAVEFFGGVRVVAGVHVLLFIFFTSFILVHPYLSSLAQPPLAHFKAMVTGYEELDAVAPEQHAAPAEALPENRALALLKSTALFLSAPFFGLAYIIATPFVLLAAVALRTARRRRSDAAPPSGS